MTIFKRTAIKKARSPYFNYRSGATLKTDEDKFERPTVINEIRLKKTQRGADNAKILAKTISDFAKDLNISVNEPGKVAVDIFTVVVGTPTVGFYTAEIEMRVVWLKRKVPDISNDAKQKFVTFSVTFGYNGNPQKGPFILDTMLIDTKTGKPIDNAQKTVAAKIENSFMDWVESNWPKTEREKKFRKPMTKNQIDVSLDGNNFKIMMYNVVELVQKVSNSVQDVGDEKFDFINFIAGNDYVGYFRAKVDTYVAYTHPDMKTVGIFCDIYQGGEVIISLQELGEIEMTVPDNSVWRSDIEPIVRRIDTEFKKQIDKQLGASAKIYKAKKQKALYVYFELKE